MSMRFSASSTNFGSFVARLDVVVEDGKVKESHYELLDVDPEKYPADQGMLDLVEQVSAPYKGSCC